VFYYAITLFKHRRIIAGKNNLVIMIGERVLLVTIKEIGF
jgi:hypothetical protein